MEKEHVGGVTETQSFGDGADEMPRQRTQLKVL
jgi:hypothetical protein